MPQTCSTRGIGAPKTVKETEEETIDNSEGFYLLPEEKFSEKNPVVINFKCSWILVRQIEDGGDLSTDGAVRKGGIGFDILLQPVKGASADTVFSRKQAQANLEQKEA